MEIIGHAKLILQFISAAASFDSRSTVLGKSSHDFKISINSMVWFGLTSKFLA